MGEPDSYVISAVCATFVGSSTRTCRSACPLRTKSTATLPGFPVSDVVNRNLKTWLRWRKRCEIRVKRETERQTHTHRERESSCYSTPSFFCFITPSPENIGPITWSTKNTQFLYLLVNLFTIKEIYKNSSVSSPRAFVCVRTCACACAFVYKKRNRILCCIFWLYRKRTFRILSVPLLLSVYIALQGILFLFEGCVYHAIEEENFRIPTKFVSAVCC